MTTKAEWIALAERCEKATGSDREIDAEIYDALCPQRLGYKAGKNIVRMFGGAAWLPCCTNSLDAITALIERELPEVRWVCRTDTLGGFGNLYRRRNPDRSWPCFAFTPALALCAAFCRAMAEKVTA
jgi:hypothetical protein